MTTCAGGRYLGETLVVEVVPVDGTTVTSTTDPATILEASWLEVGLINSKNYSLTFNSIDVTTDNEGAVASNMTTGASFECTVSGLAGDDDTAKINQRAIVKFALDAVNAGGCPKFFVRLDDQTQFLYAHCLATSHSKGGGSKEAVTFEMAFTATATGDKTKPAVKLVDKA